MLILLSPAKNLNFDPSPEGLEMTKPALFSQTKILAEETRKLSRGDIQGLMGISDKLADLNYERFQSFKKTALPADAKQAALGIRPTGQQGFFRLQGAQIVGQLTLQEIVTLGAGYPNGSEGWFEAV